MEGHIHAYSLEKRTQIIPGQAPVTILREVAMENGKGYKSIRVLRGSKTISTVREPLQPIETANIAERKFTPGLFRSTEQKTKKKHTKPRKTQRQKKRFTFF